MTTWQHLSIGKKLTLITMVTTFLVLVFNSTVMFTSQWWTAHDDFPRERGVLAKIMAENAANLVANGQVRDVHFLLGSLAADPHVVVAALYSGRDVRKAEYVRRDVGTGAPDHPGPSGVRFKGDRFVVVEDVILQGQTVGRLYMASDMNALKESRHMLVRTGVGSLFFALLLAYLLSSRLQRLISRPIKELRQVAHRFSVEGDYSLRATRRAGDELGDLVDAFNDVLLQMQMHEKELIHARDDAQQAARAKSMFVARMSHEFRTPLTVIIGFTELLLEDAVETGDPERDGAIRDDLQRILQAGYHLLSMITDVLDLAKLDSGTMSLLLQESTVSEIVHPVVDQYRPAAAEKSLLITVDVPAESLLYTDVRRLRQAVTAILDNACKFTQHGEIRVTGSVDGPTEDRWLTLAVEDTGVGMSVEESMRAFEAFYQADGGVTRHHGGTGMSLTISRDFCRILGGDMTVESQPNVGSTFRLRVPCRAPLVLGKTALGTGDTL